jgi:hypothetical protein
MASRITFRSPLYSHERQGAIAFSCQFCQCIDDSRWYHVKSVFYLLSNLAHGRAIFQCKTQLGPDRAALTCHKSRDSRATGIDDAPNHNSASY